MNGFSIILYLFSLTTVYKVNCEHSEIVFKQVLQFMSF